MDESHKDPEELVFFSRKASENELKKQEGHAVVRNVATRLLGWGEDMIKMLVEHAQADATPEEPPPPPPRPHELADLLRPWTFASAPGGTGQVDPSAGATLSPTGKPFPRWDVDHQTLVDAEVKEYHEPPGPKYRGHPSNATFASDLSHPGFEHELTYEEYRAHNLEPLYWHQRRYNVHYGYKLPYVVRLNRVDKARAAEIVAAVNASRDLLPPLPTEGKGAGRFTWTKWNGLGKETRPLVGEGWIFAEDTSSEYSRWLFQEWFKGYAENIATPARLPHMAALKTLYQEGAPSSLNTYDSCIMTWGVGFACGAPQIVAQLLDKPDVMNALYACGFLIQGFEKDGVISTIPGFHYQTLDLSDPADPKVLVWDNYYHFYGYAPGAMGAVISVRPRGDKPKPGAPAPACDPETNIKRNNKKYSLQGAIPQPQTNLELSFHIYNHMTRKDTSESAILRAFIAVARDKLTRAHVGEANRKLIVGRAQLPASLAVMQTEAAYTFVSMCKHNWGLTNAELELEDLAKHHLSSDERRLVAKWTKLLQQPRDSWWHTKDIRFPEDDMFDVDRDGATDNGRHVMIFLDALIAKAVVRRVMSVLEWDRLEQAKKRFLKAERDGAPTTVRLLDERLRKYSLLWRFDRLHKYWQQMRSGENWLVPMEQAHRIAGVTAPEVEARLKLPADNMRSPYEVPRSVPIRGFKEHGGENEMSMSHTTSRPPNWRGNAYYAPFSFAVTPAGAPDLGGSTFCCLGDRKYLKLPEVMRRYGQHLELIGVDVDAKDATKSRLRWKRVPVGEVTLEDQAIIDTDYIGGDCQVNP